MERKADKYDLGERNDVTLLWILQCDNTYKCVKHYMILSTVKVYKELNYTFSHLQSLYNLKSLEYRHR